MKCEIPIDRKHHSFSVLSGVDEIRKCKQFCDFVIKVGSQEIHAHRNILAGGSEYYRKMLSHDTRESKTGIVVMKGVDSECVSCCIDHLYGGKVIIPDGKLIEMVHAATFLQLHYLCEAIENFIIKNLDTTLFFQAKEIVYYFGWQDLENKCIQFAENNICEISQMHEFKEVKQVFINRIMESKRITEDEKLGTVLAWIKGKPERTSLLTEFVKMLNPLQVCSGYRKRLLETEPLLAGNKECFRSLSASLNHSSHSITVFDRISGHLQRFSPQGGSWEKMHRMKDDMNKNYFSVVTVLNCVYVLMKNRSVLKLELRDAQATWEAAPEFLVDHGWFPPAVASSGEIYVIGQGMGFASRVVEKFNPVFDAWVRLPDKPQATDGSAVISFERFIYSFGGYNETGDVNTIEMFCPTFLFWTRLGSMIEKRSFASAVHANGKIYIFGGCVGNERIAAVECFDVRTKQCSALKPMNMGRRLHRAFEIGGVLYAFGGDGNEDSIEKYDVSKDEWDILKLPKNMTLEILDSFQT